ncbi:lipoprotein, partial [Gilliamella apicola]
MRKLLFVLISVVLLTGCGDKTIDASSPENLKKSLSEM